MLGLMIAQKPLKIAERYLSTNTGDEVQAGVYRWHTIGGGGAGHNLDLFDSGLDGRAGSNGSYIMSDRYVGRRTIRQANTFTIGAGGTVRAAPQSGNPGGSTIVMNPAGGVLAGSSGGAGGSGTSSTPWSEREPDPTGFPFNSTLGQGGRGARGGGASAQPGVVGAIYAERIA